MKRNIEISTDVFAAIWASRKDGEESENQILERLFNCKSADSFQFLKVGDKIGEVLVDGYFDNRNNVHFPEGFVAFRNYKGSVYKAIATNGQWLRPDNQKLYQSLNKLNESIAAGVENIWNGNWQFINSDGGRFSIDVLRE
jgi:hypothetical protein